MLLAAFVIVVLMRTLELVISAPCDHQNTLEQTQTCSHFYGFKSGPFNYTDIFHFCENYGGMLAMPHTEEKFRGLQDVLQYMQKEHDIVLLGARAWDEALTLRWNKGSLLRHTFTKWGLGEPNVLGPGKCVHTRSDHWLVFDCDVTTSLVSAACEFCLYNETCPEVCLCPDSDAPYCSPARGCNSSCLPVRRASSCDYFPCPQKRWGPRCQHQCNCLNSTCDAYTGKCPGSCEPPWTGESCDLRDDCPRGRYGPNCSKSCFCAQHQHCDERGDCPLGCLPGVGGPDCSTSLCKSGTYGTGCHLKCQCATPEVKCAGIGGECLEVAGCRQGIPGCDVTPCARGTWGPKCELYCVCREGGSCRARDGECPASECMPGWLGTSCNSTRCPVGRWGQDCSLVCTECEDKPCDVIKGTCITHMRREQTGACPEPCPQGEFCNGLNRCQLNPTSPALPNSGEVRNDTGLKFGLMNFSNKEGSKNKGDGGDHGKDDGTLEIVILCVITAGMMVLIVYTIYGQVRQRKRRAAMNDPDEDEEASPVEIQVDSEGTGDFRSPTDPEPNDITGASLSEIRDEEVDEEKKERDKKSLSASKRHISFSDEKRKTADQRPASEKPSITPKKDPSVQQRPASEQLSRPPRRDPPKGPQGPRSPRSNPGELQSQPSLPGIENRLRDETLNTWTSDGQDFYEPRSAPGRT